MSTSRHAATAVLVAALVPALAGCGNFITTEIVGMVGVTADAEGRPVVIVAPCGAAIDRMHVVELLDRSKVNEQETNPVLLELARSAAITGPTTLNLAAPGDWTPEGSFDPAAQAAVVIGAASSTKDQSATPVQVTTAQYADLDASHVRVREDEVWTRVDFDALACRRDAWPSVTRS